MKKLLPGLLALLICPLAGAEWISYQQTAETEELYDPAVLSRDQEQIKLWTLTNYAKAITSLEAQELLSEKTLTTIDCAGRKMGAEKVLKYAGKNGQGAQVGVMDTVLRLTRVREGSAEQTLMERLCQ